jgi:hypothetical protein
MVICLALEKSLRGKHYTNDQPLQNVLRKWRIHMLLFKGGIKTVEKDGNYISK